MAVASASTASAGDVVDAVAPTLVTVTHTGATTITLTFSKKLKAATFAATLNGFSVNGTNAELSSVAISGGADSTTVVLTGTGFDANTTVSYNSVAGITDVADNALASFSAQN